MAEKDSSRPKSNNSYYCIHDPPGYIDPSLQDFLLTDITGENLLNIAENLDVEYVGKAEFPGAFPVIGNIVGLNKKLMVNLACKRRRPKEPWR